MVFTGTKGRRTKPPAGVQINPLHPLSRGLVGCWLFNEGAGSRANDISGHGNHGVLKGMSPNVQGSGWGGSKFGGGLQFDGVDDYVNMGDSSTLRSSQGSISLLLTPESVANTNLEIVSFVESNWTDYVVINLRNGTVRMYIENDNVLVTSLVSNVVLQLNELAHVVITQNGTLAQLYVNGSKIAWSGTNSAYWTSFLLNNSNVYVGKKPSSSEYAGTINSVSIYNRAIATWEIEMLYHDPFCNLLQTPIRFRPGLGAGGLSIPVAMNYYRRRRIA